MSHKDVIKVANLQLCGGFISTPTKTCFCFITLMHAQKYLVHLRIHTCQPVCFPKSHTQARSGLPSNSHFSKPVCLIPPIISLSLSLGYTVSQFVMLQRQFEGSGHDAGACKPRRSEVEAKLRWQAGATASQNPVRRGENEGHTGVFPFHTSPLSASWSTTAANPSRWRLLFRNTFMYHSKPALNADILNSNIFVYRSC